LALGLYTQLSSQTPDHGLSLRCLNRIEILKQRLRASPAAGVNANYPPPAGGDPRAPGAPTAPAQPSPAVPAAPPPTVGASAAPTPPGPSSVPTPGQLPPAAPPLQTVSGRLRRTAVPLNNQLLYALEMPGQQWYVTAPTGLSLEAYVYRNVELQGTAEYNGLLRTWLLTVSRVTPLP